MQTNPANQGNRKINRLLLLLSLIIIEGAFSLLTLFLIKADLDNGLFLGYSGKRLILAGFHLFLVLLFGLLWLLIRNRQSIAGRIIAFLSSLKSSMIFTLILVLASVFLVWSFLPASPAIQSYRERLLPLVIWFFLISGQTIYYRDALLREEIQINRNRAFHILSKVSDRFNTGMDRAKALFDHPALNVLVVLALCTPLLLQNAFKYQFPVGVAGLYALMAERVAENHFALPMDIPYYGPGGIPFAYPPLSFYVMAFFTGLTGLDAMTYLRFAAPVFCLLSLIPMYLLAKELTGNAAAATLASMMLATYSRIYLIHGQAAGMTRALAFLLSLCSIYAYFRAIHRNDRKFAVIAAIFLALTTMTHPTYVELFAVSAGVITLLGTSSKKSFISDRIQLAAITAIGGVLLSSPWWLTTYLRFGSEVFLFASDSHDSLNFLAVLQEPRQIVPLFSDFMYKLNKSPLLAGPALLGFFWLLVRRDFLLPVWALVYIFIFGGYDFLIITIAAILAAILLMEIVRTLQKTNPHDSAEHTSAAPIFLLLILSFNYYIAYRDISSYSPSLSSQTMELAGWFHSQTDEASTFIRLTTSSEEAEWYPYLLRRTPVISSWGAEWTGEYKQQYQAVNGLISCTTNQSLDCVSAAIEKAGKVPDYIISDTGTTSLNAAFEASSSWKNVYQNAAYVVWQNITSGSSQ